MKDINEMTEREVIDEITSLGIKLESIRTDMQNDEKYEQLYEYAIDRLYDLDYALTNCFPHLIGEDDKLYSSIKVPHLCADADCLNIIPEGHIYCQKHNELFHLYENDKYDAIEIDIY